MDTKELVRAAAARFKHSESRLQLQEKYSARLTVAAQGGMWTITPQFLAFLRTSPPLIVTTDIYNTPLSIVVKDLLDVAETVYATTMREWHQEYNELSKNR